MEEKKKKSVKAGLIGLIVSCAIIAVRSANATNALRRKCRAARSYCEKTL